MSLLRGSTNRGAVNPREDEEGAMEMVGTNFFILKGITDCTVFNRTSIGINLGKESIIISFISLTFIEKRKGLDAKNDQDTFFEIRLDRFKILI